MSEPIPTPTAPKRSKQTRTFIGVVVITAILTAAVAALLVNIFQRKQEARNPYLKLVEVDENTSDPAVCGMNWSRQYDQYQRTVDVTRTRFGGSEAMPEQKLDRDPWLRRMFSGYAFAIDYRDRRGHAYMLQDQEQTERVLQRPQPGACVHCHASVIPTYRRIGAEARGVPFQAAEFDWPSVMKGFELVSAMKYGDAHAELQKTPDGSPPPPPDARNAHPVSCIDCHDPDNMELRVTRPGFVMGIADLAKSDAPVPHIPSIQRWREGDRRLPYNPNVDATRQEMRTFACAQCHVEYYCGPKVTLFYPWGNGLKVEDIEKYYDNYKFPDGHRFFDWKHGETGAEMLKAQHPEFEIWSQGTHARAGVACADCHMPYMRDGAMKISDHHVRSPLLNISRACQTCHPSPEDELLKRVETIQDRTHQLMQRAALSLTDMMDAIRAARATGATDQQLQPALELHRKAQWRLDFIAAENSMGFHAPQETARVLAEAIDYARQGQISANDLRTPQSTPATQPAEPVYGVTPVQEAPARKAPKP